MQSIQTKGICLIYESTSRSVNEERSISTLPLCLALAKKAIKSRVNNTMSCAILTLHLREDLPTIGWTQIVELTCENISLQCLLDSIFQKGNENRIIFLDSTSSLVEKLGVSHFFCLLKKLEESGAFIILPVERKDLYARLRSISETSIEIINVQKAGQHKKNTLTTNVMKRRKGTFEKKVEEVTIGDDYGINSQPYIPRKDEKLGNGTENFFNDLPFDIGLKLNDKEKEARSQIKLPYTSMQKETGLLELNISSSKKLRAGGQILYTPEKEDDFDEDDPDDDLSI